MKYQVAGNYFDSLDAALAYAKFIHTISGIIVAVELVDSCRDL